VADSLDQAKAAFRAAGASAIGGESAGYLLRLSLSVDETEQPARNDPSCDSSELK
jgi:hypothetical protein